ncbi:hypothetical protein AGMMS49546_30020 [Spirochaetia bacterium]|nr:hypothetical protein AGMMS49546_30020 [Spirochaetia bacterium]
MKNKFLLILAAAAAFAALSCTPALEVTAPDLGELIDSKNAKYDGSHVTSWGTLFTIPMPSLNTVDDSTGANKTVTINFFNSTYYLDLLHKSGADFEAGLKEGFQFIYFTSTGTSPVSLAGEAPITVTSVTRSGNTAYVQLALPAATISSQIQVRALADKLTYNGGNKVDGDGNYIPGEEFYDDYFQLFNVANAGGVTPLFYKQQGAVSFTVTNYVLNPTAYTYVATLSYNSYSTTGDATDYASVLSGLVKVQKYNRSLKQWENYPNVSSWSRQANNANYDITISGLVNTDALRFVYVKPSDFKTGVAIFGIERRLSGATYNNTRQSLVQFSGSSVVDGMDSKSFTSTQRGAGTFNLLSADSTLPGNRGVVLRFSFSAANVGDQGLNAIDLASFQKAFKIGTADGGAGSFIPIEKAELVYDPSYAFGFNPNVPNRLNVYLDPAYVRGSATRYLYLSPGYGYKGDTDGTPAAGVFGDYTKYDTVIDGQTDWSIGTLGPTF